MNALDSALARIEINANAFAARRQRIASDTRIVWLKAFEARVDAPITEGGMMGGMQTITSLWAAENIVVLRVRALICARAAQIDGLHGLVRDKLALAAELRRQFVNVKNIIETSRAA